MPGWMTRIILAVLLVGSTAPWGWLETRSTGVSHGAELPARLTLELSGVTLREALESVARAAGIELTLETPADDVIDDAVLRSVPVEDIFRRLLTGYNYLLFYDDRQTGLAPRLTGIRVLARGQTRVTGVARATGVDPPVQITIAPPDGSPSLPSELVWAGEQVNLQPLLAELRHRPDASARRLALEALTALEDTPFDSIIDSAHGDGDPAVRLDALVFLERRWGAEPRAREALRMAADHDVNDEVREAARLLLDE
jgi:hypothetical protein